MLDNSYAYNFLAEEIYVLEKSSPSSFNFLDFPLLARSCQNFSYDFWDQESVFV